MAANVGADTSAQAESSPAYSAEMSRSRIAELGALLGDATRAQLLTILQDGRASTVGELARASHVAMSTASEHLSRLHDAGLVQMHAQGRHRYYRLAGPDVAGLLEAMEVLPRPAAADGQAGPGAGQPWPAGRVALQPGSRTPAELRFARTCYDHLAGRLGVALADTLVMRGHVALVQDGGEVTESGFVFLSKLGVARQNPLFSHLRRRRACAGVRFSIPRCELLSYPLRPSGRARRWSRR